MARERPDRDEPERAGRQVDLHGLRPDDALRRLERELHTARLAGAGVLTVVTGRGLGNRLQQPILREHVVAWLKAQGNRFGVRGWRLAHRGGALEVDLAGSPGPGDRDRDGPRHARG